MATKDDLGKLGENLAADFLVAAGYTIIDRNWRCSSGEVDIVALDGKDTVFVEVKTRSSTAFGHPFEAITTQKLNRLRHLALAWCREREGQYRSIRIDAISVIAAANAVPNIEHLRRVSSCR